MTCSLGKVGLARSNTGRKEATPWSPRKVRPGHSSATVRRATVGRRVRRRERRRGPRDRRSGTTPSCRRRTGAGGTSK